MGDNNIYFDNNATTSIAPEVLEEMKPFLCSSYGNPSSAYPFGVNVRNKIERARRQVASLINAEPDEIIFTSGATESNNTAFFSSVRTFPEKNHIITTAVEHSSIMSITKYISSTGCLVSYLPVDGDGRANLESLRDLITENTLLVSIMYANNETGNIYPIREIASTVKKKNKDVLVHTDAVQAIGKIDIDVRSIDVDLLSMSGHKFHAPKGIGALYLKKNTPFTPFIFGGHQENGFRGGTENASSIIALGKAAEVALAHRRDYDIYVRGMRDYLENSILNNIEGAYVFGDRNNRVPNTTNIGFEGLNGEEILLHLGLKGICVSTGSACNSVSADPSHVLRAMQVPHSRIRSVRFSLSRYNNENDVEYLLNHLYNIVNKLRRLKENRKNVCVN